jgi:hypothetical protein
MRKRPRAGHEKFFVNRSKVGLDAAGKITPRSRHQPVERADGQVARSFEGYVVEISGECVGLARNARWRCLARRSSSALCS